MKKGIVKTIRAGIPAVGGVLFLVAVWTVCYAIIGNEYLVSSPWDSLKAAVSLFGKSGFYGAFSATLLRAFLAFLISVLAAAPLAAVAFAYPVFGRFLAPIVACLRALPTLAVLLLLLVFLGGNGAAVAVGVSALFPMLYTSFYHSLAGVDGKMKELCAVYEVPIKRQIEGLYLPQVLPKAVASSGAALSFALKLTVSAEILAVTFQSLGGLMQEAKLYAEIPQLFALVGVSFVVGLLMELSVNLLAEWMENKIR